MKHKTFSFLLAVLMSMAANVASAYTIYFRVISEEEKTAMISYRGNSWDAYSNEYTGSITIPETVTSSSTGNTYTITAIDANAFRGCSGLTSVTIGNSVTSIGSSAFSGCTGLTSVTIPESVTSIGYYAFSDTNLKKTIWLTNTPPSGYTRAAGTVNYVPNDQYTGLSNTTVYPYLSSLFEVDGIKYVPVSPSERTCDAIDCTYDTSIEHINIGKTVSYRGVSMTVKNVQPYVCCGNGYIKDVSVDYDGAIGSSAFSGCTGLTSVTIGSGVTSIGYWAFYNCSGLTSVTIGESVTSIGYYAFYGCQSLTKAEFASIESLCKISFDDASANPLYYAHHLYIGREEVKDLVIPNSVTKIGNYAFYNCTSLSSVTIPNSVTSIGSSAFSGCTGLTSVTIPNSVTSIDWYAFYGCTGLTSVTIPNSVTSIRNYVFSGCTGLTSVTIPESVTSIGDKAFYGCTGLTSVTIPNSVTYIGDEAFRDCTGLTSVTIPYSVTSIRNYVFSGCTGLTSIEIPNSVTSIGNYAFEGCSGLTSITIPNSVTYIENQAFDECTGLKKLTIEDGDSKLSLGYNYYDKEGSSGQGLFYSCPLETLYLGRSISYNSGKTCGYSPFYGKTKLTSVTIGESVTSIGEYSFRGCTGLTSVTIPESVTSIGSYAFYGCTGLTSVIINSNAVVSKTYSSSSTLAGIFGSQVKDYTFGDAVSSIGTYACYNCSNLSSVTVGNNVTDIGDWAFSGCSSLTDFRFGPAMKSIGKEAFSDCTAMTKLYGLAPIPPVCGDQALDDINKWECILVVPEGYTSAYQTAPQWKEFFFTEGTEVEKYTIRIVVNGKVYETESIAGLPLNIEDFVTETPTKEGYTFVGWEGLPETMPSHSIEVKAIFTVNSYTVTFMYGDVVVGTTSVEYGAEIPLPETLDSDRYTLVAWTDVPETMPARDITIYADYTDGIDDINDNLNPNDNGVYDLSGRKINVNDNHNHNDNLKQLKKGVYIVNGRKVFIQR